MQIEIVTKQDLEYFRQQLLQDLSLFLGKQQQTNPEYLRSKEVRKLLNISAGSLVNLRVKGLLQPVKIAGIYYYKLEEIHALKNSIVLWTFFHAVQDDNRLSAVHLSVCFVLYRYYLKNKSQNPISIRRRKIMSYAKIRSTATYHKVIADLQAYNYITYVPSYHPAFGSSVTLLFI